MKKIMPMFALKEFSNRSKHPIFHFVKMKKIALSFFLISFATLSFSSNSSDSFKEYCKTSYQNFGAHLIKISKEELLAILGESSPSWSLRNWGWESLRRKRIMIGRVYCSSSQLHYPDSIWLITFWILRIDEGERWSGL